MSIRGWEAQLNRWDQVCGFSAGKPAFDRGGAETFSCDAVVPLVIDQTVSLPTPPKPDRLWHQCRSWLEDAANAGLRLSEWAAAEAVDAVEGVPSELMKNAGVTNLCAGVGWSVASFRWGFEVVPLGIGMALPGVLATGSYHVAGHETIGGKFVQGDASSSTGSAEGVGGGPPGTDSGGTVGSMVVLVLMAPAIGWISPLCVAGVGLVATYVVFSHTAISWLFRLTGFGRVCIVPC